MKYNMNIPPLADVQNILNQIDEEALPELRISVLRNIMLEPIEPYLKYLAFNSGFHASINFGQYDNVFQEAVGGGNLINEDTDCVLVFTILEGVSWRLARAFVEMTEEDVQSELERAQGFFKSIVKGIRSKTSAIILWHAFEHPLYPTLGALDGQVKKSQANTIQQLNQLLLQSLKETSNAYFVDLNLCIARLGGNAFYDNRFWHIGRAPYTLDALAEIAKDDFKFIRASKGKNKKCLVLDCDGVLWGGVVGEDGLSGIKLGTTHPGSPYREFQQEVVNLCNRGILLALCSKNNIDDVWEVFREHPDMVLNEKHIVAAEINWQDKAANLKQIASNLNIGLDSMVFMDDSEFEVELIRSLLPEVEAIHLPPDKACEYRTILLSCGFFDSLSLTEEDKKRSEMYKAEGERKQLKSEIQDMDAYFKSLEMEVEICFADDYSIPRISQLTQKTNQFNLTTKRYSDEDIKSFAEKSNSDAITMKLSDRFGDLGIVGVCILKYEGKNAVLDSFLLSCRALGRGVEEILLFSALKLAKERGCLSVVGEYMPSRKNKQVEKFYQNNDFTPESISDKSLEKYRYDLNGVINPPPESFKTIDLKLMHK